MTSLDFDSLYSQYRNTLYNIIRRRVNCDQDAEDLVGDTFVEALSCAHLFRGDSSAFTWLVSIARHLTSNFNRDEMRHRILLGAHLDTLDSNVDYDTDDDLSLLVSKLSETLQPVVVLKQEGFTEKEICGIIGIPLGTVKSRLFTARQLMRLEVGDA